MYVDTYTFGHSKLQFKNSKFFFLLLLTNLYRYITFIYTYIASRYNMLFPL